MTLNVNPADLVALSQDYSQLALKIAELCPATAVEVQRIIDTHGAMGYPVALGVVAGLARREPAIATLLAAFGAYSERFVEHASTYVSQDTAAASSYSEADFGPSVL